MGCTLGLTSARGTSATSTDKTASHATCFLPGSHASSKCRGIRQSRVCIGHLRSQHANEPPALYDTSANTAATWLRFYASLQRHLLHFCGATACRHRLPEYLSEPHVHKLQPRSRFDDTVEIHEPADTVASTCQ